MKHLELIHYYNLPKYRCQEGHESYQFTINKHQIRSCQFCFSPVFEFYDYEDLKDEDLKDEK